MAGKMDIIVAGLVALMSNGGASTSHTTALVVNDCCHLPLATFIGEVRLVPEDGSPIDCDESSLGAGSLRVVSCALNKTDIEFREAGTDTVYQAQRGMLLPEGPRKKLPSLGEDHHIAWLLRLKNIAPGLGNLRQGYECHVGGRMVFGWRVARSCVLDGSERRAPSLVGFKSGSKFSHHQQSVAEALMFEVNAPEDAFDIVLVDRVSGSKRIIQATCSSGHCLTISFANQPKRLKRDSELAAHCRESDHFQRYYDILREGSVRFSPIAVGEIGSSYPKPSKVPLLSCSSQEIASVFSDLAPNESREKRDKAWERVADLVDAFALKQVCKAMAGGCEQGNPEEGDDVGARAICPPVIVENSL